MLGVISGVALAVLGASRFATVFHWSVETWISFRAYCGLCYARRLIDPLGRQFLTTLNLTVWIRLRGLEAIYTVAYFSMLWTLAVMPTCNLQLDDSRSEDVELVSC